MENLVTPSERAQSLINPHSRTRVEGQAPHERLTLALKIILGTPIPILFVVMMLTFVVSESALFAVSGFLCALILLYVIVDFFSSSREARVFFALNETPLALFFLLCLGSVLWNWNRTESLQQLKDLAWIAAYFLFTTGLFLFPGLNRLFSALSWFVPLGAAFVLWQRFYGLKFDLADLPQQLAQAIRGLNSVGLFASPAPLAIALGSFIAFGTAAFFVPTRRASTFKLALVFALSLAWLGLVTTHSLAILVSSLAGVLAILLYCQRSYFALLLSLILIFVFLVPKQWLFYREFSPWLERGPNITQEKREIAKAELNMFQDSVWTGAGWGAYRQQLSHYLASNKALVGDARLTSNNYFSVLSATGLLGFALFMCFTLIFFLRVHRLWLEIPQTHYWHRTFVLGCLGSQVVFHVLGLYQSLLHSAAAMLIYAFFLAVISYLNESYSRGIIPDDYSL